MTSRSRSRSAADVGIETSREAVEYARVAVLGSDPRTDGGEPREELLLLRDGGGRPRAHLLLRRPSSRAAHARRQRRGPEQHDVALRGRDGSAHAENALPTRLVDRLRRLLLRAASRDAEHERDHGRTERAAATTEWTHTHRGHGNEGMEAVRRTVNMKRPLRRCPCRARAERTRRREARRGARSSRRRRRRPRPVRSRWPRPPGGGVPRARARSRAGTTPRGRPSARSTSPAPRSRTA